jgi:DNA-binding transcriptional MerR regulator
MTRWCVRIGELADRTGVSAATIKYYLREGILPRGQATSRTRASYDEEHVRRLRLVRALREVGGLDVATIRDVVAAINDPGVPRHALFGLATRGLAAGDGRLGGVDPAALPDADQLIDDLGWRTSPDAPARRALAEVLLALRSLGRPTGIDALRRYADAASDLASWEVRAATVGRSRAEAVESVVIGTVLYEAVFNALRRLAHEHWSAPDAAQVGSRNP